MDQDIHQDLRNPAIYAHLQSSDISLLRKAVEHRANWSPLLSVLVQFASEASDRQFIDNEALYMLGRDLSSILPQELKRAVLLNFRVMPEEVCKPLSNGISFSKDRRFGHAPLKIELRRILDSLDRAPEQVFEEKIRSFHSRYLAYVERTGLDYDFVQSVLAISKLLLSRGESARAKGAQIAQDIVRDALVWQPNMKFLWIYWAKGLIREGALCEAEDLLWNIIRRFPDEFRVRTLLARVILSMPERTAEALALTRENIRLFGETFYSVVQFSEALSRTGILDDTRAALALIATHAAQFRGWQFHSAVGLIAKILVDSSKISSDLEELLPNFSSETIEGAVASLALRLDPTSLVAQTIFRRMLDGSSGSLRTRNNLAKAMAATGKPEDLTEAEVILRANLTSDPGDPYAAGQLAGLIRKRGDLGWRGEALKIVRDALEIGPNEALQTHYATLLTGGDGAQKDEAKSILESLHAQNPSNGRVRLALARWYISENGEDMHERVATLLKPVVADASLKSAAVELLKEVGAYPNADFVIKANNDEEMTFEMDRPSVQAHRSVPSELRHWGELRRRRFLIENGLAEDDQIEIGAADTAQLTYAHVLAARGGHALDDDVVQGSFQVALEVAVYNEDSHALNALAQKYPRLSSIILLAKAILGDESARSAVNSMLSGPYENDVLNKIIYLRLKNLADGSIDFNNRRSAVLSIFHDTNEMTLQEYLVA